jgi:hypothetical protein
MSEEMNFESLEPRAVPIRVGGKVLFILREASEGAGIEFQNASMKGSRLSPDGKTVELGPIANARSVLLAGCLYKADADGNLRLNNQGDADPRFLVPAATIRSWKQEVVEELFEKCKAISPKLVAKETKETLEKNLADVQAKLAVLSNGHAEKPEKNEPTTEPSESPTS